MSGRLWRGGGDGLGPCLGGPAGSRASWATRVGRAAPRSGRGDPASTHSTLPHACFRSNGVTHMPQSGWRRGATATAMALLLLVATAGRTQQENFETIARAVLAQLDGEVALPGLREPV